MMVLNLLFLQKHIKKNDFTKNVFLIANCYLVHHLVKKDNNFDDEVIRMIISILDQKGFKTFQFKANQKSTSCTFFSKK